MSEDFYATTTSHEPLLKISLCHVYKVLHKHYIILNKYKMHNSYSPQYLPSMNNSLFLTFVEWFQFFHHLKWPASSSVPQYSGQDRVCAGGGCQLPRCDR